MTSPIPHEPPAPLDGFGAPPREIRAAVRWATRALGAAGIASAPVDALLLAAVKMTALMVLITLHLILRIGITDRSSEKTVKPIVDTVFIF